MTSSHTVIDIEDLGAAVRLLEATSLVDSWDIGRITNDQHAIHPIGEGLGLTLMSCRRADARDMVRIFEKAGAGRTLLDAAAVAIQRLTAVVGEKVTRHVKAY